MMNNSIASNNKFITTLHKITTICFYILNCKKRRLKIILISNVSVDKK